MPFKFFTSTGQELVANSVADLPIGAIIDTAASSIPNGWLACDGSAISRTGYADLFGAIGTFYGTGDGSTTFNLPNLSGSIIYATPINKQIALGKPPAYATSLPSNPIDGQEVYVTDGSYNAGVVAHRRYKASSASWEYVGENPANLKTAITNASTAIAAIPTYVTSLPSSPTDGQEVYYAADASNGVIWHLRYRSGSGSSYKWEYVGGQRLVSSLSVAWITNNTSYSTSANINGGNFPTITVPLSGDYDVTVFVVDAFTNVGAGYTGQISYQVGGTAASDNDGITFRSPGGSYNVGPMEATSRKTGIPASTVLSMAAKIDNGAANLYIGANSARPAGFRIVPVRVG